jgi:hypothetical protein
MKNIEKAKKLLVVEQSKSDYAEGGEIMFRSKWTKKGGSPKTIYEIDNVDGETIYFHSSRGTHYQRKRDNFLKDYTQRPQYSKSLQDVYDKDPKGYSEGGSTYAEGGEISRFSDFKNKVIVRFVEKENGDYVTEVLHYPSGELKDKSIPTKVKSIASRSYIKKLGENTDGILAEGSFTEWIKANRFDEKHLKMLNDIAKQYNVKIPNLSNGSSTYAEGGEKQSTTKNNSL